MSPDPWNIDHVIFKRQHEVRLSEENYALDCWRICEHTEISGQRSERHC